MRLEGDNFFPKSQKRGDSCTPTAIEIVWRGLCNSHRVDGTALDEWAIKRAIGWRAGWGVEYWDPSIPLNSLNRTLQSYGYRADQDAAGSMSVGKLKKIVSDFDSSAPVITVNEKYVKEQTKFYEPSIGDGRLWHDLVVTRFLENDIVELFDPLTLLPADGSSYNKEDYKITIPAVKFLNYWSGGNQYAFWIQKISSGTAIPQRRLKESLKGEN
ncbi:MAG: hypothetical protein M1160_03575 [Candidatus Marsarchaeota archaeon]|jgi:hypothetical protein|nr:hypothetical protein [Candidatus Marsarchaeota archaeon]MCL5111924.1 hypothetical protein [Candidatus Marsarchaeota archaeon]